MTNVPVGMANNISCSVNSSHQSPARRYYASSPSRRPHDSCSDVSYSERPLLGSSVQSTPCRRHYDTCPTEAQWNGRDGSKAVVHRIKTTTTTAPSAGAAAPPQTTDNDDKNNYDRHNDDKNDPSSSYVGRGSKRPRSQAQMVDVMSRILFPCMFLIFNIVYWPYYLFFCAP